MFAGDGHKVCGFQLLLPKRQDVRGLISDEEQAQELMRYKPKKCCLGNTDHVLAWSGIVAQGTVVSLLSEK